MTSQGFGERIPQGCRPDGLQAQSPVAHPLSHQGHGREPPYTVPRPPPYTAHQQLQPLHPLISTVAPWPSMLTSQSTYSPLVVPAAPLVTPVSTSTASTTVTPVTTTGGSTPRRTLTDDDQRRMCEYHESHPGVKQTEIGGASPVLNHHHSLANFA